MKGVKISDHQQSMALLPLRGAYLIPPALLGVADLNYENTTSLETIS